MQKVLFDSLIKMLKPLVRVLLRHGVSHSELTELTKQVYVQVADRDFALENRKQTSARISVLTGIQRKEVRRLKKLLEDDSYELTPSQNRAARVLQGWLQDPQFQLSNGTLKDLPIEGDNSFATIVKRYSGDLSAKVVLEELIRVGAVEKRPDDQVHLCSKAYVPQHSEQEKLRLMGDHSADMLNTISHNLQTDLSAARFQLAAVNNNLPQEALATLRNLSEQEGFKLLQLIDEHLNTVSLDNPIVRGTGKYRAGFGLYYFEEPLGENSSNEK